MTKGPKNCVEPLRSNLHRSHRLTLAIVLSTLLYVFSEITSCSPYFTRDSPARWTRAIVLLILTRYSRLLINIVAYHLVYKPAEIPANPAYTSDDVHVVVSTIDPSNHAFETCIRSILLNQPKFLTIVTGGEQYIESTWKALRHLQADWGSVQIDVSSIPGPCGNKRKQMCLALDDIALQRENDRAAIIVFVDDHAWWSGPAYLSSLLAPFEDPNVGLVGTGKRVQRNRGADIVESSVNFLGCVYLERHNFDLGAQNAIDGGMWVVSARTCAIRTSIATKEDFRTSFTNERYFGGRYGPLNPDDDNFITRYVVNQGYATRYQAHPDAIMYTTLGERPDDGNSAVRKFHGQLVRWCRSQWRNHPRSLTSRSVWSRYGCWSAPFVYGVQCFNFAMFWDGLIIYSWYKSDLQPITIWYLMALISGSKMVKLAPHFLRNPRDLPFFLLYVPFAYYHSFIKLYALLTCTDGTWSGRKTAKIETADSVGEGNSDTHNNHSIDETLVDTNDGFDVRLHSSAVSSVGKLTFNIHRYEPFANGVSATICANRSPVKSVSEP